MRAYFVRLTRRRSLLLVLLLSVVAQAATDKPLEAGRLDSIPLIEVVRFATPEIQRFSSAFDTAFPIRTVAAGKTLREQCKLEDFGELVVRDFVAQVSKQIPTWPKMRVVEAAVKPGYAAKDAVLLRFELNLIMLWWGGAQAGFSTVQTATLVTPGEEVIWTHRLTYSQKEEKRDRSLEDLEANSCKLLKEEMQYAAGVTAGRFIGALKRQQ